MRAIKLIKHAERKVPETRSRIKAATRRDRSSQGVRSWVVEFKKTRRGESLIAFDSLFKDALLPPGGYLQQTLPNQSDHSHDI